MRATPSTRGPPSGIPEYRSIDNMSNYDKSNNSNLLHLQTIGHLSLVELEVTRTLVNVESTNLESHVQRQHTLPFFNSI